MQSVVRGVIDFERSVRRSLAREDLASELAVPARVARVDEGRELAAKLKELGVILEEDVNEAFEENERILIDLDQAYGIITPEMFEMVAQVKTILFGETAEVGAIPDPPPGTTKAEYQSPLEQ